MEKRYNVISTYETHPDAIHADIVKEVALVFKISEESAEAFLSTSKPRVIKKNVPIETANTYREKLTKIGLEITLEEITEQMIDQPMIEDTTTPTEDVIETTPAKLYSPAQIAIGTYFGGPLAATYFLKTNFDNLDKMSYAKTTLSVGIVIGCLLIVLSPFIPEKFPSTVIPLVYLFPVIFVVKRFQLSKPEIKESSKYSFQSNWKTLAMTLIWLAVYFIITALVLYSLEVAGIINMLGEQ